MGNTPVVAKQDIAKYVQDMAEIEAAEFTLRKAAEEMRKETERIQRETDAAVIKCEKDLQYSIDYLQKKEKELDSLKREVKNKDNEILQARNELTQFSTQNNSQQKLEDKPQEPKKLRYDQWNEYCNLKEPVKPTISIGAMIGIGIFACNILVAIVFGILAFSLLFILGDKFTDSLMVSLVVISIPISIILYIIGCIIYKNNKWKTYRESYSYYKSLKTAGDEYVQKEKEYKAQLAAYEQARDKAGKLQNEYNNIHFRQNKLASEVQDYQKIKKDNEEALFEALQKQELEVQRRTFVYAQIDRIEKNIQTLYTKKKKLYTVNIIPPDYRELDCVLMFHQIFRNDLADTMREAVKIYEERVFRQEVIRGIDKIYRMLGHLASSMSSIESRLVQIRDEVKLMGNDVYQMSQNLANSQSAILKSIKQGQRETVRYQDMSRSEQQRFQEKMLSETRASVYATEALKDATDKLVWYEERKYWKNL